LLAILGNVTFTSQSGQQNVEDIADGGFAFDDENIARPKAVVHAIPCGAGRKE
jgi:hypothetical protein